MFVLALYQTVFTLFSQYHITIPILVLNKSKIKEMESFAQNFIDQKSRITVAWVWRWEWKLLETGHEESNWWDGTILNMIYGIPFVYLWYIACIFTKITELYTWIGWMLCCRKYTTLKMFKEKKKLLPKVLHSTLTQVPAFVLQGEQLWGDLKM